MELNEIVSTGINGVLAIYIGYIVKNSIPAYFGEKGKNLATKQDIGDITRAVEDVRKSFVHETEELKANLQISTNIRLGLAADQKKAVLDFVIAYDRWYRSITGVIKNIKYDSKNDLDEKRKLIEERYQEFLDTEAKMRLFVDEKKLWDASIDLTGATMAYVESEAMDVLDKLQDNVQRILDEQVSFAPENADIFLKSESLILQKIVKPFQGRMIEQIKILRPEIHQFYELCRDFLNRNAAKQLD